MKTSFSLFLSLIIPLITAQFDNEVKIGHSAKGIIDSNVNSVRILQVITNSSKPSITAPTRSPTIRQRTASPTRRPTPKPTTSNLTPKPTSSRPTTNPPTNRPTPKPTTSIPTPKPTTSTPTPKPTTSRPTPKPTTSTPTPKPSLSPTKIPTTRPIRLPTPSPTRTPTTLTPRPTTSVTKLPTKQPISVSNTTLVELIEKAKSRIRDTIKQNRSIAANYLRLGFHDCVPNGAAGGCDGCVNLVTNRENAGLDPSIDALAPIVAELENTNLGFSRADIWALAVLIAADESQDKMKFSDAFVAGRKTCEAVGSCNLRPITKCAKEGPDTHFDFPTTILTTHELLDFMNDHFGFNMDETVALMGAHTLGKALPKNSGYEGENGWVTDMFTLDNEYYKVLTGSPDLITDAPKWTHVQQPNGLVKWNLDAGTPPRQIFMLNVDIALVRDLAGLGFLPDCTFHLPKRCPIADTLSKTGVYRNDNLLWLSDFKKVLIRMLGKGLNATS